LTPFNQILELSALARPSTQVAPELIGCTLVRQLPSGQILRGPIVETEAHTPGDPAFYDDRRVTPHNQVVFGAAGRAYIYQIYGIYYCLNVVTDREGVPSAGLIRALQLEYLPSNLETSTKQNFHRLATRPGKLCRILQIDRSLNGTILQVGKPLWIEQRQQELPSVQTTQSGLSQGTDLPWRWYVKDCPAVSTV
jgi:DNA-3-methyladenine glycosylase